MRVPRLAFAVWLAGAAAIAVVWAACAIYDASLLIPTAASADAPSEAATPGGDAGVSDAGTDGPACTSLVARPPAKDDGFDGGDYVMALRGLRVDILADASTTAPPRGLNLDRTCTCPGPESCKIPSTPSKDRCDDSEGRDNAAAAVFTNFSALAPEAFQPAFVREEVAAGRYTLLVRLQGYNGTPNDTKVAASMYASNGLEGIQDAKDGGGPTPKFDGNDAWTIDPASTLGGDPTIGRDCRVDPQDCTANPNFSDPNAYVSDGVLVARINVPLAVTGLVSSYVVELKDAYLVGKLTPSGTGFGFVGEYTGRWGIGEMLRGLAFVRDPVSPSFLCRNNTTYQNVKKVLCGALDLVADPQQDNKNVPCNAISTALSLEMSPAQMGRVYKVPQKVSPCPQDADAGLDSCPP